MSVVKIQPTHCDRLAYVYVRQSTPWQVLENRESTERQYQLSERRSSVKPAGPTNISYRPRSLCSYCILLARYIGVACAIHVLGRSRRSILRLRRATFWCLLVFTRNVLPVAERLVRDH